MDSPAVSVNGQPTLLRKILIERHWQTPRTFRVQYTQAARDLADVESDASLGTLSVSDRQFQRWLDGAQPRPDACRVLEYMFGRPVEQLLRRVDQPKNADGSYGGAGGLDETRDTVGKDNDRRGCWAGSAAAGQYSVGTLSITQCGAAKVSIEGALESQRALPADGSDSLATSDWPVWFGVRLARLVAMVDNWQGPTAQSDALQALLHQEILMFDAIAPENQHPVHAISRRQALVTLAALPLTFAASGAGVLAVGAIGAATELFLSRCAASLTACWRLLKGSDLRTVDQMLSTYLLELEGVAQRRSAHQEGAARLASQAHRICGIVALHRNQLRVREHHCKQAFYYAALASDASSQASALISLASTFFYDADPARAAAVYEQALSLEPALAPLQRSRIQAELSVVYGQLGREQDALRSAGLADQLYPGNPEQDRSFLYAEFTRASLTLEQGLAYAALAERYPGRAYQRRAADIFAGVEQAAPGTVPDRIRFEITNHQARTAVLLNDLDAFEIHMGNGIDGIVQLGSRQREKELRVARRHAIEAWPRERRVKALGERLQAATIG
jgi:tetratricopeptide (TPR) repeat protein